MEESRVCHSEKAVMIAITLEAAILHTGVANQSMRTFLESEEKLSKDAISELSNANASLKMAIARLERAHNYADGRIQ